MVGLMSISLGDAEEFYGLCKGELIGDLADFPIPIPNRSWDTVTSKSLGIGQRCPAISAK